MHTVSDISDNDCSLRLLQCKRTDVGEFTFNAVDYIYNNNPRTKGVWTKVDDLTTISIYRESGGLTSWFE